MNAERSVRTALVHDWLTGMRGGEKVLEVLAGRFEMSPIYTLFHLPGTVSPEIERHPIQTSYLQNAPGIRRHYRRYLPLFPAAIENFDLTGFDLIVSSSHCVAKGAVPRPGAHHLCYCHTPMRYAWDQEHAYFPTRSGLVARIRGQILTALRAWDVASIHRVDQFIANSRFVAERIRRYYGRDADVLPPPVDTEYFAPGGERGQSFVLAVAALAPYKRIDLAIAACDKMGLELRIVGEGPEGKRLARETPSNVRLLGRVDGERLRQLYREALCFVQPGVEDFGISSVEALACGCPVVAVGRGGVLDIVRDGVDGVLFSQDEDPDAVAAAIDKCRRMSFNQLNLRQRAEQFSVARFEEGLNSLLSSLPPGPQI